MSLARPNLTAKIPLFETAVLLEIQICVIPKYLGFENIRFNRTLSFISYQIRNRKTGARNFSLNNTCRFVYEGTCTLMRLFFSVCSDVVDELVFPGEGMVHVFAVLPPAQKWSILNVLRGYVLTKGCYLAKLQSTRLKGRGVGQAGVLLV